MKKLLSVILVVVMCLSCASVAFAEGSPQSPQSPSGGGTIRESITAVDAEGVKVAIAQSTLSTTNEVYEAVKNAGSAESFLESIGLKAAVNNLVMFKGLDASKLKVHSLNDVYVKKGSPVFPVTVQLALAGVKTTDTVVVIHKAPAGYEVLTAKVVKNGVVEVVFDSLSPVVVLVGQGKFSTLSKCKQGADCVLNMFDDLVPTAWYHDGIHFCVEEGMMQGIGGGKFDPTGVTSRAMIVTMLWRLQGQPVVDYAMTYTDVAADTWYTSAVRWATSVGVVEGVGGNKFDPEAPIIREQLATMLYRYEQKFNNGGLKAGETVALDFPDKAEVSTWAADAMQWAVKFGIVKGSDGKLIPGGNASRAEAAAMLQRYCAL